MNGRVFVNNVSLGVYAEAVGQEEYRAAKIRTLMEALVDTLGPEAEPAELRWRDGEGAEHTSTALILVSNNAYRLGPTIGSGTRPRLDEGMLGIVDFEPPIPGPESSAGRYRQLKLPELEIESDAPIALGIDGEALTMDSPLRFRIRPRALRVRIAHVHPGASPSAEVPRGVLSGPQSAPADRRRRLTTASLKLRNQLPMPWGRRRLLREVKTKCPNCGPRALHPGGCLVGDDASGTGCRLCGRL